MSTFKQICSVEAELSPPDRQTDTRQLTVPSCNFFERAERKKDSHIFNNAVSVAEFL
jgi:hypothetical protein